jgi:hypothetical protein
MAMKQSKGNGENSMKILISGNREFGLAKSLYTLYPQAEFASRSNGYDLCSHDGLQDFAELATHADVVVINAALWRFQQTVVLDAVYKACTASGARPHIITVGSTTDRVKKGGAWLYNAEKKALRDYSNTLGINGVWSKDLPKVSYISFGTLSNNQHKHPDRNCLDIDQAADYVKWLIDQPKHVNINEISIDPMQGNNDYD